MNSDPAIEKTGDEADELRPEYLFDYAKARLNRFRTDCPPGGRMVVLEPDIAQVFTTAESVNSVLRAVITTMPPATSQYKEKDQTARIAIRGLLRWSIST